jgi:Fe-S cluster assembly protein SufD
MILNKNIDLKKVGEERVIPIRFVANNDDVVRVSVRVRHLAKNTKSRIVVRGVLFDKAQAEVKLLTKIDPGATGSDAWTEARLLLFDEARGIAVPDLEILENEVKAGHAASVGRVSEEEMFYLMSRGLPRKTAVKLLVEGFLAK